MGLKAGNRIVGKDTPAAKPGIKGKGGLLGEEHYRQNNFLSHICCGLQENSDSGTNTTAVLHHYPDFEPDCRAIVKIL
jgi:hypothetical protein